MYVGSYMIGRTSACTCGLTCEFYLAEPESGP